MTFLEHIGEYFRKETRWTQLQCHALWATSNQKGHSSEHGINSGPCHKDAAVYIDDCRWISGGNQAADAKYNMEDQRASLMQENKKRRLPKLLRP
jgi:hypothetical protein